MSPIGAGGARAQAAVVAALGDERADVGVHPPGLGEQHAAAGRDRLLAVEEVLEHRGARAAGVVGLGDLRQLLRVAEQHEVLGGQADGGGVGERELAGLVDEEQVERLAMLGRARTARPCRRRAGARR